MGQLTTRTIKAVIAAGKPTKRTDGATVGAGALTLVVRKSGAAAWYYRHGPRGRQEDYPLGPCDPEGKRGLSLAQARGEAATLTRLILSGVPSLSAHFAAEEVAKQAAEAAQCEAEARAKADAERRATRTLRALVQAYADHLRSQGKPSWRRALNSPARHVPAEILDMPAADVRAEHLLPTLRRLIDTKTARSPDGKGTAARLLTRLPLFGGRSEPNLLINLVATPEGRHYTGVRAGTSRSAAATAESLGGGCSGRVRCRRCSSSVWSRSGWV